MTIPESLLPPQSQRWGRWVTDNLRSFLRKREEYDYATQNAIRQLNLSTPAPMRGVIFTQDTFTVPITTAGVYVPLTEGGTVDPNITFNMAATAGPNLGGLKNITDQTRTLVVVSTYDGKGGNNNAIGLKLALNGTPIDGSECQSFGGPSGQVGKAMTQWIVKLEPDDEISMFAANIDDTVDLTVERFKMIAHAIQ